MRLPVETFAGHARRFGLALILLPVLAGCTVLGGGSGGFASAPPQANGPAADYPVVIGEPYRVGDTLYRPEDTLNYDEVGYAAVDRGKGISATHHILPLPSYVEVTSLESGRTILVRLERRGPLDSNALIALSPAALAQLGAEAGVPVRVRRVNPPEEQRALLRAGRPAPLRMDTPDSLVAVLKRELPESSAALPGRTAPPAALTSVELPPSSAASNLPPARSSVPARAPARAAAAQAEPLALPPLAELATNRPAAPVIVARQERPRQQKAEPRQVVQAAAPVVGDYVVQAIALSTYDSAKRIAGALGGSVSKAGSLYRVRTGPFATRSQAEASLAKVRAAGYSEARIFTNG